MTTNRKPKHGPSVSSHLDAEPTLKMRLVLAGQLGDTIEIDAVTDQLALIGLCRPRRDDSMLRRERARLGREVTL